MFEFVPQGIMTALVTPFHPDGSLNVEMVSNLVRYQMQSKISGVVVTAGAGEYVTLRPEERAKVVKAAATALDGKLPLIAAVLEPDTRGAISACLSAQEAGANALLVLTPYYISPSPAGLVDHFRLITKNVDLPIILYNIPGRTGINLELPVLEQLIEITQVVGIKECDRDLGRVARKIDKLGSRLCFLSGEDDLILPLLGIGCRGAISAHTNIAARWAVAMFEAVEDGKWAEARELFFSRILKIVNLYKGPDHPGPLKQAMGLMGLATGMGRPPLHRVSEERLAEMAETLRKLGLMEPTSVF